MDSHKYYYLWAIVAQKSRGSLNEQKKNDNHKFRTGVRVSSPPYGAPSEFRAASKKSLGFTMGTNQICGGFESRAYPFGENINGSYPFLHTKSLIPPCPMPIAEFAEFGFCVFLFGRKSKYLTSNNLH